MAEKSAGASRRFRIRHRGRGAQVFIYLGKQLRMFVYQNDWKVLPMAALIAGLVGMVIRRRLFVNMEGSLMGAFALTCVGIWNGCFNSIQVICRERSIVKREHRSGMHISAYVFSHMLYQGMLCLLQTGVTMYVLHLTGVQFPEKGLFTPWLIADIGISVFIVSYAADMLSLWMSALSHSTTAAMTVMPFVLIFQLIFSGGMLSLPKWSAGLTRYTISNYGLRVICAQTDYNNRPLVAAWNTLERMQGQEIGGTVTLGQVLDLLGDKENPAVEEIRAAEVGRVFTLGEVKAALESSVTVKRLLETRLADGVTLGDVLGLLKADRLLERYRDVQLGGVTTVGRIVDALSANEDVAQLRDRGVTFRTTVGRLLDLAGKDRVRDYIQRRAMEASFTEEYSNTRENILSNWMTLVSFALLYALLAAVTLEFIDHDKR